MTIAELMDMCIEPSFCKVTIYSVDKDGEVWCGMGDDIPEEFGDLEFDSFDVPTDGAMTFNI